MQIKNAIAIAFPFFFFLFGARGSNMCSEKS